MRVEQLHNVVLTAAANVVGCAIPAEESLAARAGSRERARLPHLPNAHRNLIEIVVYETGQSEESTPA